MISIKFTVLIIFLPQWNFDFLLDRLIVCVKRPANDVSIGRKHSRVRCSTTATQKYTVWKYFAYKSRQGRYI